MAEINLYDVLIRPIVSEKTNGMISDSNQYVFEVAPNANKRQIREAVEIIFEKKVVAVNTMIVPAKRGMRGRHAYIRSQEWKKAIVTLAEGEKIDLFEV
jgi:large subunit ribosomal protein L23